MVSLKRANIKYYLSNPFEYNHVKLRKSMKYVRSNNRAAAIVNHRSWSIFEEHACTGLIVYSCSFM